MSKALKFANLRARQVVDWQPLFFVTLSSNWFDFAVLSDYLIIQVPTYIIE